MSAARASRSRAAVIAILAGFLLAGAPRPASAYLKIGVTVDGRPVSLTWSRVPARYFVTDAGAPGVTASQFADAVRRGLDAWQGVGSATIAFEFAGFTGARPLDQDGASTIGFLSRPELERTLAATSFLIDTRSGEILEADVFFNTRFAWSTADAGEPGRFDVQSIATHEAGHFLGLGHSALGETEMRPAGGRNVIAAEAVMFPVAYASGSTVGRTLRADDIAGVSDIYPAASFRRETGSITGKVTRGGRGLFGAHVVALNLRTGRLVSTFTLDDEGTYVIAGLSPGSHVVRVEPLDDGDVESFFDGTRTVDADFRVAYHPRVIAVPAGGTARPADVTVVAR